MIWEIGNFEKAKTKKLKILKQSHNYLMEYFSRVLSKGLTISPDPIETGRYLILDHFRDNPENPKG